MLQKVNIKETLQVTKDNDCKLYWFTQTIEHMGYVYYRSFVGKQIIKLYS